MPRKPFKKDLTPIGRKGRSRHMLAKGRASSGPGQGSANRYRGRYAEPADGSVPQAAAGSDGPCSASAGNFTDGPAQADANELDERTGDLRAVFAQCCTTGI